jgi:hypothetical protein
MPLIAREEIDPALRARYEGRYKAQLRDAMHAPGLTAVAREHLRAQIRTLSEGKVYVADSPPKEGALALPSYPSVGEVKTMKKGSLIALAEEIGLADTSGTKPELLDRVLAVIA